MNRFSIFLRLLGVTCFAICVTGLSGSILKESQYWPEKVTVHKTLTGRMFENPISAGREWVFLRTDDETVLVDMGHNGVFALEPSDTDVVQRIRANKQRGIVNERGLFSYRHAKWFYEVSTKVGLKIESLDDYEAFVLFYFNYEPDGETAKVISKLLADGGGSLLGRSDTGVLLLPNQNLIAEGLSHEFLEDGLNAPVIAPYKRSSFEHAQQHFPEKRGDIVVIDKNGQVFAQFFFSDLGENASADALHAILKRVLAENK